MGYIGVIQSGECGPRLGRGSYGTRKRRVSERKKERLGLGKNLIFSKSENQQPGKHLHICIRISRLLLAQARDSFFSKERIPTKLRISVIEMITWPLTRHFILKKKFYSQICAFNTKTYFYWSPKIWAFERKKETHNNMFLHFISQTDRQRETLAFSRFWGWIAYNPQSWNKDKRETETCCRALLRKKTYNDTTLYNFSC